MDRISNIEEIIDLLEHVKELAEGDTAMTDDSKFNLIEKINEALDTADEVEDDDSDDEEEDDVEDEDEI